MYRVLRRMSELGVEPDTSTYVHVIRKFVRAGNLEMAILYLVEMEEKGLSPRLEIAEDIITLAASKGHPRLAIDLAVNFEASTIRALSSQVWIKCLISATDHLYVSYLSFSLLSSSDSRLLGAERRRGPPLAQDCSRAQVNSGRGYLPRSYEHRGPPWSS